MTELMNTLAGWFDPQLTGPLVLQWGGRILSALAIFLIGRSIAAAVVGAVSKALTRATDQETLCPQRVLDVVSQAADS